MSVFNEYIFYSFFIFSFPFVINLSQGIFKETNRKPYYSRKSRVLRSVLYPK